MYDPKPDIQRFFKILDMKEESDNGNIFNPIYISCCRVMLGEELGKIFERLKAFSVSDS